MDEEIRRINQAIQTKLLHHAEPQSRGQGDSSIKGN